MYLFRLGTYTAILALLLASAVMADEKVPLDKVPQAVLDAVKAKFPKAKLLSAEKENEDGKIVFEIKLKSKGAIHEVTVTPEGKIVSIEKEIKSKDLPQVVADALAKKYPKAKIKKTEEVSKGDKVTVYEMLIVTEDNKTLEVEFDPTGKFLKEEKKEKTEKKEKKD